MTKDQIIATLQAHQPELRHMGVVSLSLFGSVARNEAGPESDVDLFFDYDDPRFSLIELIKVQEKVADILGTEVDVTTRDSLHPMLRSDIESSAITVF